MRKICPCPGTIFRAGAQTSLDGPYGLIILGVAYLWSEEEKCLKIHTVNLVCIDMKYRMSIDHNSYEDMYDFPFEGIYEENGVYYYDGYPIINYKFLNLPRTITTVTEEEDFFTKRMVREFYNPQGSLKYSVNPVCTTHSTFENKYRELYGCVLSFDENTHIANVVGFDSLGKLMAYDYNSTIESAYEELIRVRTYFIAKSEEEEVRAKEKEHAFLNMTCKIDESGNKVYTYTSIWE